MEKYLPDDLIWEIYRKLHKSYMYDLKAELEEFVEELEWRKENNLGDDFAEWEESSYYTSSSSPGSSFISSTDSLLEQT